MAGPGPHSPFGKDKVAGGSEGFITEALHGGRGPSEGIYDEKIDRKDQSIKTAVALDNVQLAAPMKSSIIDDERGFHGSTTNLKHSIEGAEAPADGDVGAAGPVDHVIISNH